MRATVIHGAITNARQSAGSRVFPQVPTGGTLAVVRAIGVDTAVRAIVLPLIPTFVDVLADASLPRVSMTRGTRAITVAR